MFKLKIIDKPEMFKMKCNFEFPKIPIENLQEKEVNPTTEKQEIVADKEYSALSKVMINAVTSDIDSNIQSYNIKKDVSILGVTGNVIELNGEERATTPTKDTQIITPSADKNAITKMTVNPIPDEYIIPSGEIEITANGNYNVTDKASAKVNVPIKTLGTKTITKNGVYNATNDNLDGYSQVTVETSGGVDINEYFSNIVTSNSAYNPNWYASVLKMPPLKVGGNDPTNGTGIFYGCTLVEIPKVDTSEVTYAMQMFYFAKAKIIPEINASKFTNIENILMNCTNLEDFGGLLNLGQAYPDTSIKEYLALGLQNSNKMTHDSLMNVLNKVYDISSKNTQIINLGSTNLAKLTAEEVAIGTSKGWSIS